MSIPALHHTSRSAHHWINTSADHHISTSADHLSGSGNIITQNQITGNEKIDLSVSGSGDIKVDLHAPEVQAEMSGSGDINLSGEAKKSGMS